MFGETFLRHITARACSFSSAHSLTASNASKASRKSKAGDTLDSNTIKG